MRATGGRHELKHYINQGDLIQLRSRLPCVMTRDGNTKEDGIYRVRSLYFDNYKDKALLEKVNGVDEREKFRIRFYNNDCSFVRLEKKSKKGGLCFKTSAIIEKEICEALLQGQYERLKESGHPLHMELYAKMCYEHLRPKTIVDYKREAFVFGPGNVRVTLDYDLRFSMSVMEFLKPEYITIPLPQCFILEVKYDCFLPELVRGVVTLSSRRATAFSKYAATRII